VGLSANDLKVEAQASPNMTIKVNPGSCFVLRDSYAANDNTQKFWNVVVTATTNVTIPTADPSNPRIDLICVKVDTGVSPDADASNVATLVCVQGTAAGSPSAPSIPTNHLKIAEIAVAAGVSTIVNGNITDSRTFVGLRLPYNQGFSLENTQGSENSRFYEDSTGKTFLKNTKSGGYMGIDPITNKLVFKGKSGDTEQNIGASSFWTDVPGSPVRSTNTQFTLTDTGNANSYDLLFKKGVVLKWTESNVFKTAMVISSSYATNTVTVNIVGDSLGASFTGLKYCVELAKIETFIVPGTLAAGTDLAKTFHVPYGIYVISADAYVKTAGTTNANAFDINDDSTTMFTTKPSIASGATSDIDNVSDAPSTEVAAGSLITADIDSVSTTPPTEAYLYLYYYPSSWRYRS
jgi:hypothetical protein